jgi:hypothetical protein
VAAQALAPGLADRQAAKMWEAQLRPTPPVMPEGNLFEPGMGDPGIDGPFADRVKTTRQEFFTSRIRDTTLSGVAGLAGMVMQGAGALRAGRRG